MQRVERLGQSALTAIERALEQGDARSALAVLRGLGLLKGGLGIGSDDPETLAREARVQEEERALAERSDDNLRRMRESLLDALGA
ncbi:MAG TPA: hypothetical protein VFJ81_05320 [Gemmatimonadales bacterium]|nr:hypothetical protein [Gemmatimonadales bacterium]